MGAALHDEFVHARIDGHRVADGIRAEVVADLSERVRMREGKFRTFLLASLARWLDDQRDRAYAQK